MIGPGILLLGNGEKARAGFPQDSMLWEIGKPVRGFTKSQKYSRNIGSM